MIVALQIGKEKSTGRPGKNYMKILGRQLNEYSLMVAKNCKEISKIYVSTDSDPIKKSAEKYDALVIDRPPELATPEALTEDALSHAYEYICEDINQKPEMVVLLLANAPMVDLKKLEEGIQILRNDSTLDACVSVAKYNMFSPIRAKSMKNNIISPFVDLKQFDEISSIRSSQGDVYFNEFSIQILRPQCFENIDNGNPPLKWMGKKTYGIEVDFGFDIDQEWQIPVIEYWLRKQGFSNQKTP